MNKTEQEDYLINLRREKVQSLLCQGKSQTAISQSLSIPLSTVHSDVMALRAYARDYVLRYEEHFSHEFKQCIDFLNQIMSEAWTSALEIKYERNKAALLAIAKDCVIAKTALVCDVSLIDRTVLYIEELKKKKRVKRLLSDSEDFDDNDIVVVSGNDMGEDSIGRERELASYPPSTNGEKDGDREDGDRDSDIVEEEEAHDGEHAF